MEYILIAFLTLGISLLLKLHYISGIILLLITILLYQQFKKNRLLIQKQKRRFFEASEYMDTLLYNFLREGKIERTYENLSVILSPSPLKEVVDRALEHMKLTFDETEVYKDGIDMVEREYHCDKISGIHEFMYHVENYGGQMEASCQILLEDKNCWEKRIRSSMGDRERMFRQVILSVIASLIICGIILYMPIRGMDIVKNPLVQLVSVIVVVVDELILLKAQKFLCVDWLQLENTKADRNSSNRMRRWKGYDEKKARKASWLAGGISLLVSILIFWIWGPWPGFIGLAISLILWNQHRIGHRILEKAVTKEIACEFPRWLLHIVLLMQSENVQVALQKSYLEAPPILREDIHALNERLEIEAEASEPYHAFLGDFHVPEVHSAMIMLYSISMGNSFHGEEQMKELIRRNLLMLDDAQKERLRDRAAGLYLLFLAPVLTASVKLLVDMFVVMFAFITRVSI